MRVSVLLVGVAVWTAWRPVEVVPFTAPLLALAVVALVPWAWDRTSWSSEAGWWGVGGAWLALTLALSWDRSRGIEQAGLLATVLLLAWIASRERPDRRAWWWWAAGIAALSLWAGWQVISGFESLRGQVELLPPALRDTALQRIETGRAFASLPLPGHLAVLLATTVPILLSADRRRRWWSWSVPLGAAVVGVLLTRSVIGVALATGAALLVTARGRSAAPILVALSAAAAAVLLTLGRTDLSRLEPLTLRWDNWRTALWVWLGSPIVGVGPGGLGQASQAVPFPVGNETAYAHMLPAQWLAELGLAGVVVTVIATTALIGLTRRLWPRARWMAVAVLVVPLHNLVDFSLYVSGVAVPWAVLLGWSIAEARGNDAERDPSRERWRPAALAAAAALAGLSLLHAASTDVEWRAAAAPRPSDRLDLALQAQRLAPWRAEPAYLAGAAALEDGGREAVESALGAVDRAAWLRPHSGSLMALEVELELRLGRPAEAAEVSHAAARWSLHQAPSRHDLLVRTLGGDAR